MGVSFGANIPDGSNLRANEPASSSPLSSANVQQLRTAGKMVTASGDRVIALQLIDDSYHEVNDLAQRAKNQAEIVLAKFSSDGVLAASEKDIKKLTGKKLIATDGSDISPSKIRTMTKEEESELVDLFQRIMAEGNHLELVGNDKDGEKEGKKAEKKEIRGRVLDNRDQLNREDKAHITQRMIFNGIMAKLNSMFAKVEKRKSEDKAKRQEQHEKGLDKIVSEAQKRFKEATRTNVKEQNNAQRASEANVAKIRGDITHTTSRPEIIRNDVTPPKS